MFPISFSVKLISINDWTLLRLSKNESTKLPSRGMVMVKGAMNGLSFQAALEPDGKGSHWFRVNDKLLKEKGLKAGDTVILEIEPIKEWPEPQVPGDLKDALKDSPQANDLWMDITPMARWDWIRWINGTKQEKTRRRRIEVALSKLNAGDRRPCCFNRTECTVPNVSDRGMLIETV